MTPISGLGKSPARLPGAAVVGQNRPLRQMRRRPMADLIKDKTAIVGIGQTRFGKGIEDTELSLACQAISAAIDDAGLQPSDVDGLAMFSMENSREVDLARSVGLGDITYFGEIGYGGGAACGTGGHVAMAV